MTHDPSKSLGERFRLAFFAGFGGEPFPLNSFLPSHAAKWERAAVTFTASLSDAPQGGEQGIMAAQSQPCRDASALPADVVRPGDFANIYEFVEHLTECEGRGRGDEHCTCGAVQRLDEIERAWALLWTVQTSDRATQNARRLLSEMIDQDGRRRGIALLKPHEMPTGPTAEMTAPDFDGQEVTASADGALEASSTTGTGGPIPFPPPPKDPTHDQ